MKGRILFPFLLMSLFLNVSCDKEEQQDKNGYDIARVYTDIAFSLQLDWLKNFTMTSDYHGLIVDVKRTSEKDTYTLDVSYESLDLSTIENNPVKGIISQPDILPGVAHSIQTDAKINSIRHKISDSYYIPGAIYDTIYFTGSYTTKGTMVLDYEPRLLDNDTKLEYYYYEENPPSLFININFCLGWQLPDPEKDTLTTSQPFIIDFASSEKFGNGEIDEKDILQAILTKRYNGDLTRMRRPPYYTVTSYYGPKSSFIDLMNYYGGPLRLRNGSFIFSEPNLIDYTIDPRATCSAITYQPDKGRDSFRLYIYPGRLYNFISCDGFTGIQNEFNYHFFNSEVANTLLSKIFLGIDPLQSKGIQMQYVMEEKNFSFWATGDEAKILLRSIIDALLSDDAAKEEFLGLMANDPKFSASMYEIRNYVDRLPESLNDKSDFKFGFSFIPFILHFVNYP